MIKFTEACQDIFSVLDKQYDVRVEDAEDLELNADNVNVHESLYENVTITVCSQAEKV